LAQVTPISLPAKPGENSASLSILSDKIDYVSLESTPDFPIHNIAKIVLTPVSILVLDDRSQNLLAFSRDGHFVAKIGNRGAGPGEYRYCNGFTADPTGKNIYVSTFGDTILQYSSAGQYLRSFRTPTLRYWHFHRLNKSFIAYVGFPNSLKTNGYCCFQFNDRGRVRKKLLFRNVSGSRDVSAGHNTSSSFFQDTVSFWESGYDTIYHYTEKGGLRPRYTLKTNGNYLIGGVSENQRFILFRLSGYSASSSLLYDKTTKRFYGTGSAGYPLIANDLDMGPGFSPMFSSQDYYIDVVYYASLKTAIEALRKLPAGIDNDLTRMAKNLNENSNPVLRMIKVYGRYR
jgi:hypothetical protein